MKEIMIMFIHLFLFEQLVMEDKIGMKRVFQVNRKSTFL